MLFLLAFPAAAQWIKQNVDTTASLRGLSVVNEKVVWASGTGGTVIRTIDGGKTWNVMIVPDAEKLDFRDVEAFDANTAYILSIGNGESSRIYKTTDGGSTWKELFRNKNEKAFYDAIACWDRENCVAMSDPVDGRFVGRFIESTVRRTVDMDLGKWPDAKPGEAAFAASGTCLIAGGKQKAIFVSGGTDARVFVADLSTLSKDFQMKWQVSSTPIIRGTSSSGIFSIAMFDRSNGVIVGGNYEKPHEAKDNLAFTTDGGMTWKLGTGLSGYRSGVTYVDRRTIVAVGTNGSDVSGDGGRTWRNLDRVNYNAVQAAGSKSVWAVGPNGNISRLDITEPTPGFVKALRNRHHPVNVNNVRLSHSEIRTDCPPKSSECSSSRFVSVDASVAAFDEDVYDMVYTVSAGHIIGKGHSVQWDLTNVPAGKYLITTAAKEPTFDGRTWMVIGKTVTNLVEIK